ncbi:MAG TPA: acyltransferase [Gemmatimonadaceae bacterium]|nr:acyltransferase [Gemmatimonadaceae bacterium]
MTAASTGAPAPRARRYVPALDGLRGIAVVAVFLRHVAPVVTAPGGGWIASLLRCGWIGIDLFFVLSGFLITGILLDTRGERGYYGRFYARRARRILPVALLTVAAVVAVHPAWWRGALWLVFYGANIPIAFSGWLTVPTGTVHFWSLAVEEQFYLTWPLLISCVPRPRLRVTCLALVAFAFALRIVLVVSGSPPERILVLTPARLDGLALGALLADLSRDARAWSAVGARVGWIARHYAVAPVLAAAVVALLLLTTGGSGEVSAPGVRGALLQTVGYLGLAVASAVTLAAVLTAPGDAPLVRALSARPLRAIGSRSYGIYIYHLPIIAALAAVGPFPHGTPRFAAVAAVLTLAAAWASWRWIEEPMLRPRHARMNAPVHHATVPAPPAA